MQTTFLDACNRASLTLRARAWSCTQVDQRTLALTEVVQELIITVSAPSLSPDDAKWIREQGDELQELAAQQIEAIQVLERGAISITQLNRDLTFRLQEAESKLEALEYSAAEMTQNLESLQSEKEELEREQELSPRHNKALAQRAEQRRSQKDLTPLEHQLAEALQQVEQLQEELAGAHEAQGAHEEAMQAGETELASANKTIEKLELEVKAVRRQLDSAIDAKSLLEARVSDCFSTSCCICEPLGIPRWRGPTQGH